MIRDTDVAYFLIGIKSDEEEAVRLASHSHKLASAMEAATNGIAMAKFSDGVYKILFANKAFYALTTLPESEVVGHDAKQVFYSFINDQESRKILFDISYGWRASPASLYTQPRCCLCMA